MELQNAVLLVVHLLLISTVSSWSDHQQIDQEHEKRYHTQTTGCHHPCEGTMTTKTMNTDCGTVFCLVSTVQELTDQLYTIGGYNRHYVAITLEDAEANFVDQLPRKVQKPRKCRGRRRRRCRYKGSHRRKWWARSDPSSMKEIESREREEKRQELCLTPRCQSAGQVTTEGNRTCPACQRCRKLASDYFPSYVNEVSCDSSTSGNSRTYTCSPGFGTCKQRKMTIDVLVRKKDEWEEFAKNSSGTYYKEVWDDKAMEINSCCECFT